MEQVLDSCWSVFLDFCECFLLWFLPTPPVLAEKLGLVSKVHGKLPKLVCHALSLTHVGTQRFKTEDSPDLASLLNGQQSDPRTRTVHHSRWSLLPGDSARLLIDGGRAPQSWYLLFMCPKTSQVRNKIVNRLAPFLSPSIESRSFEVLMFQKISLEFVEHSFPFRSGGKELGKRPFCFFVVYSSRLCRGSYLSDGIRPTLWDELPPCSSSALDRIGRIGKNHEQPPRRRVGQVQTARMRTHNSDDIIFSILIKINAQLEFQHFSSTSEIHRCTSEIFRHVSNVFSRYHKTIWIDQLLHYNFQTHFQGITKLSELISCCIIIFRHISRYHKTIWIDPVSTL